MSGENSPRYAKVDRRCSVCAAAFKVPQHRVASARYCSQVCMGIGAIRAMPKKETAPERNFRAILRFAGIPAKAQVRIENVCIADFLVGHRLVVFCDGDYWHRLPHIKLKDRRQGRILSKLGYVVIRFWESEIEARPNECLARILDEVAPAA